MKLRKQGSCTLLFAGVASLLLASVIQVAVSRHLSPAFSALPEPAVMALDRAFELQPAAAKLPPRVQRWVF